MEEIVNGCVLELENLIENKLTEFVNEGCIPSLIDISDEDKKLELIIAFDKLIKDELVKKLSAK